MLVLSRKTGKSVVITTQAGETIRMTVVQTRGDKVRLGFEADPGICIDREEVDEAKKRDAQKKEGDSNGTHAS